MKFIRPGLVLILLIAFFAGCKKENDHPQWDVEVLGPIAKASLGINNLVSDTIVRPDADGLLRVHYDTIFSAFKLDSLYQFQDTTILNSQVFAFPFSTQIIPNTVFSNNNNFIRLNSGNVQLKQAITEEGTLRIRIKNVLQSKINFNYTIPKAKKNGQPFSFTASVDSGSATDPKYFTQDYDFSGYDIDLSGPSNNQVNVIAYTVTATSDANGQTFTINSLDTILNVSTTFIGLKPSYVRGYLGQNNLDLSTSASIGVGDFIKSGLVALDSVRLQIDLTNYIGADGQAEITSLQSINTRTGNTVSLTAPSLLNQTININRAVDLGSQAQLTQRTFVLDKSNSNIIDWVENIPNRYSYDLAVNINPQGNISGSNDFIYSDQLLYTRLQFDLPLRVGLSQLELIDSIDLNLISTGDYNSIGNSTMTLVADNGFPFDLETDVYLANGDGIYTDTILSDHIIPAAPTDANKIVTQPQQTRTTIAVNAARKERLLNARKMYFISRFTTANFPELYPLYERYKLNLKLIASGIYSIR